MLLEIHPYIKLSRRIGMGAQRVKEHPLYEVWKAMRKRCSNDKPKYKYWHGKGITVCEEWKDFWQFVTDMGPRPDGYTLERINNDLGYNKSNCKWATYAEQGANRSSCRVITLDGETKPLIQWSKESGVASETISYRAKKGWPKHVVLFKNKKGERVKIKKCGL